MKTKTNKSPKLRTLTCVICRNDFQNYISPSEIKKGRGKVCSFECKHVLNGLQKRTGTYRTCKRCGEKFYSKPSEDRRGYVRVYCSRYCFAPTERGKAISIDGYYVINSKKVHRTMMEEELGRKLQPSEIVHHINGDKLDNRIDNLQIVTRSEHNQIHKRMRKGVV